MNENDARRPLVAKPAEAEDGERSARLSRRFFLKGSGAAVATGAAAVAGRQTAPAQDVQSDAVPVPPASAPPEQLAFFSPEQAALVDAIAARLIPGDADDPGAREAGVVFYIDRVLSHGDGFAQPTYRQGPWAMTYEGDEPPAVAATPFAAAGTPVAATPAAGAAEAPTFAGGPAVVWVAADQIELYGFQSRLTPRDVYELGLPALNRYATDRFGAPFVELSERQQDQILAAMEDGEAEGFDAPTGEDLFETLLDHTVEGFFSDPVYGGNRNMVGWRLVGFPGSQRSYAPAEMKREGTDRQPQSLAGLPHFHAGRPDPLPVLPVRGNDERRQEATE